MAVNQSAAGERPCAWTFREERLVLRNVSRMDRMGPLFNGHGSESPNADKRFTLIAFPQLHNRHAATFQAHSVGFLSFRFPYTPVDARARAVDNNSSGTRYCQKKYCCAVVVSDAVEPCRNVYSMYKSFAKPGSVSHLKAVYFSKWLLEAWFLSLEHTFVVRVRAVLVRHCAMVLELENP